MATSTERTVRDTLIAAIRGISSDLGFDAPQGNVKDYPLEMHHDARASVYLQAMVSGKNVARCWAVDVRGHDEPFALGNISKRTYVVRVIGYYAKGQNGDGYKDLVDHATKVRGAIRSLTNNWSLTVSRILSATPLDVNELDGTDFKALWQGIMTYTAERTNPDF